MPHHAEAAPRSVTTHPSPAALFRPFDVAGLTLPNRIVMAPMTRGFSPGGVPGADVAAYYARRAAGGTGLIITEGVYTDHPSAGWGERVPHLHGEAATAGWQRVVDAVHAAGGRIVAQMWHVGAQIDHGSTPGAGAAVLSPSGLGPDGEPHADRHPMTAKDVDDVIASYVRAAGEARRRGFDGVEIHAAHGYLIDQFLWSATNRRTDAYGGTLVARTRFAREVVTAVRAALPADFPLFFRFSQWKVGHYDARLAHTPQELEALLAPLADAGVDVFHASTRFHSTPGFEGSGRTLAGWVKKLTGRPVIAVGAVGQNLEFMRSLAGETSSAATLDRLLEHLEGGEYDLVAVGRSLLADPRWSEKIRTGRASEVTPFSRELLGSLH